MAEQLSNKNLHYLPTDSMVIEGGELLVTMIGGGSARAERIARKLFLKMLEHAPTVLLACYNCDQTIKNLPQGDYLVVYSQNCEKCLPMHKTYLTFGQDHIHYRGDKVFDKDCVAVFNLPEFEARKKAFELFGDKWFTTYTQDFWDETNMQYYPRGYINVD
jgi:hypothetical protein